MSKELKEKIASKKAVVGVIGLGYIGISLLDAFGSVGFSIVGFDLDEGRVNSIKEKNNYLSFLSMETLFDLEDKGKFKVSTDSTILTEADVIVISVSTSLDQYRIPDLTNLRNAFRTVKAHLKPHQLIIVQSSTYPGTTEEELLPLLEDSSRNAGRDFYLAHVPEVADPGNTDFAFKDVPRMVSGITPICLELAATLYETIGCPIVRCSSTRVAEAAKLLQNSYRLINISFINEMKMMFDHMNMDVWEVIKAASSKPFGFQPFYPGPGIGGDCIPVTPFYLVWKASVTEGPTTMLEQAGHINEHIPIYVFNKLILGLNRFSKPIQGAKILVLGVGYKQNVNQLRESPSLKLITLMKKMQADVSYHDPYVPEISSIPEHPGLHLKSIQLDYGTLHTFDAILILTDHTSYDWKKVVEHSKLVIDTRNVTGNIEGAEEKVIKA